MAQEIRQIAASGVVRAQAALWTGRSLGAAVLVLVILDGAAKLIALAILKRSMGEAGGLIPLCRTLGMVPLAGLVLVTTPRLAMVALAVMLTLACSAIANHPLPLQF